MIGKYRTQEPQLNNVSAWRAAVLAWLWICLWSAAGVLKGMSNSEVIQGVSGKNSEYAFFLGALFILGVMGGMTLSRLSQASASGELNFVVSRTGWLIVLTVLGACLWAAPSGAFGVLLEMLKSLPTQAPEVKKEILAKFSLGQLFVVLAVIPWLVYVFGSAYRLQSQSPVISARIVWLMLLLAGLSLSSGAEGIAMLFNLAVSR